MFKEQKIAKTLLEEVKQYFGDSEIKPVIDLEGAGVHWYCNLKLENHKVSIYSCHISYHPDEKGRTEEFIVSYFANDQEISSGRTSNRKELIESTKEWLCNKSKEHLYKFDFVDLNLRKFQKLEREWINEFPDLANTSKVLENQGSGIVRYEISNDSRSCWSTGVGNHGEVYFGFTWDGCTLFETETKRNETAEVLKRYLIDREAPSSLNKEFSWVPVNDLTNSYEKGEGIKGEFIESWKSIKRFYSGFPEHSLPNKDKIIELINALINQGFDKTIRAGQSLTTLMLSKSRRHGLSEHQPFLAFEFRSESVHIHTEKGEIDQLDNIKINEKIVNLIKELEKEPIN